MSTRYDRIDLAAPVDDSDHSLGPENASVVLVEYGDFECPNCKQAAPAVEIVLRRFESQLRFVYRHFPLVDVHPHAFLAAEAAECAAAQGRFWEMHAKLFANQTHLERGHLLRYADELGLDAARFTAALDDGVYRQRVLENLASGERSGVRGTPGFFLNGHVVDVSFGLHALLDAVDSELHGRQIAAR